MVFDILRHRYSLAWRRGDDSPRALVIAAQLGKGEDPALLFTGGYGPEPLSESESKAIAAVPGEAPVWVKGEFPQFLESELTKRFGAKLPG